MICEDCKFCERELQLAQFFEILKISGKIKDWAYEQTKLYQRNCKMFTNLAELKALEVEYREMYEFGTVLRSELAEVVAMRKLVETVRGIGRVSSRDDNPENPLES